MDEHSIVKKASDVLKNADKLKEFAALNKLTVEMAKILLERLLKEPEMSQQAKDYVFADERSDDFKSYRAGEEFGYSRGHETGFAKGAAVGIVATLAMAGLAVLSTKK